MRYGANQYGCIASWHGSTKWQAGRMFSFLCWKNYRPSKIERAPYPSHHLRWKMSIIDRTCFLKKNDPSHWHRASCTRCYKCNKWCVRANTCTYNCTVWKHRKWTQALQSAWLVFFSFFNYSVWAQNFVLEIRIPSFFKRVVSSRSARSTIQWCSTFHFGGSQSIFSLGRCHHTEANDLQIWAADGSINQQQTVEGFDGIEKPFRRPWHLWKFYLCTKEVLLRYVSIAQPIAQPMCKQDVSRHCCHATAAKHDIHIYIYTSDHPMS